MATTTYLSLAQLQAVMAAPRLVDCLDDDEDGSLSDAEQALATDTDTGLIFRAGALADSYLMGAGYSLPLAGGQVSPIMRHHVAMVSAHYAAQRRPGLRDAQGRAPYWQEHAAALAFFELVRDGKVTLDGAPSAPSIQGVAGAGFVTHGNRGGQRVPSTANPHRQRRW